MACRSSGSGSYTAVFIPLRTSLYSLDAVRFFLWIRRLKDLEKEKDALCSGLEVLENTRLWYLQRLEEIRTRRDSMDSRRTVDSCRHSAAQARSFLLRCRIQRANGSLGSVMSEPNVTSSSSPSLPDEMEDSDLRWQNTILTQEVSAKNRQISILEQEIDALLQQVKLVAL